MLTGVDVYPANEKESLLVLRHLERQIGVPMKNIALDRGIILVQFIAAWSSLVLPDIFPLFSSPIPPKSMDFLIYPKKTRFLVQKESDLFTSD